MDRALRDYISQKMHDGRRDERDMRGSHGTYRVEGEYERDHRDYRDMGYGGDAPYVERDHRDSRRDYRRDYRYEDYSEGGPIRLTKHDIGQWKSMLENFDGSRGPHFEMVQILTAADKLGVDFRDFDEKEFCMTVNMMYADYGGVFKKYLGEDKLLHICVETAKAFLEDVDGPEPSEKLAAYYHCIVNA